MERNKLGQFDKGVCGNPRGRPRAEPLRISDEKLRQDFFEVSEMPISIVENGKRKVVSASYAIDLQLVRKAVGGEMKAISDFHKRKDRFTLEHVKLHLSNLEAIANAEDRLRNFPEDVTDEFKLVLKMLRAGLDPYFRLN